MTAYVVLSDMQIPHHDRKAVAAVQQFVKDYAPDVLLCVGDEADSPEPSRWNKGMAGEYQGTLQAGLDLTREVMAGFREACGDVPFYCHRSNHTDRIQTYVNRYAPALASLRALDYPTLVGYPDLDITFTRQPFEFEPGVLMMHGDEGGGSRIPGGTAMGLARLTGRSVVVGHTHKQGIVHDHDSVNGKITRHMFGFETGHLMDLKQADKASGHGYLPAGAANWQQGFGLLHAINGRVHMQPVPILGRQFVAEGQVYSW